MAGPETYGIGLPPIGMPLLGAMQGVRPKMQMQMPMGIPVPPPEGFNSKGFPLRPGQQQCDFYLKFRDCKYGKGCCWDHPEELPDIQYLGRNSKGLPLRPGAMRCAAYLRTGTCAYGEECRCDHPEGEAMSVAPGGPATAATAAALATQRKRQAAQQAALEIARSIGGGSAPAGATGPAAGALASAGPPQPQDSQQPQRPQAQRPPEPQEQEVVKEEDKAGGRPERKRRRGWDTESVAASAAASKAASAQMEAMVKSWVPSESQLDKMSTEELQRVLNAWKADSKFTTRDALLAKAKKIILGH